MKHIRYFLAALLVLATLPATAQFRQDRSDYEYMFKAELGYLPYMLNIGEEGADGYYLDNLQHVANVNIINGVCIKQDFFVGLGLGYGYVATPKNMADGWHSALAFVDFDYRPLDVEFSPMVGAKAGVSYLMADSPYGSTLTPYVEVSAGLNWYFRYVIRNMERNYASLFLELGFAYTQQTGFLPIRLGVRF